MAHKKKPQSGSPESEYDCKTTGDECQFSVRQANETFCLVPYRSLNGFGRLVEKPPVLTVEPIAYRQI